MPIRPHFNPAIQAEKQLNIKFYYQALHLAGAYSLPLFELNTRPIEPSLLPTKPIVRVQATNCLTVMEQAVARVWSEHCLALNMANFNKPGGGVKTGARAQEESLCRRSNLMVALE